MQIRVDWQATPAKDAFKNLEAMGQNLTPVMEMIGAGFVSALKYRHELQVDPFGKPWKPNRRGGTILTDKGFLADSWNSIATTKSVETGTGLFYAQVHQDGMVIKAKKGKSLRFGVGNGGFAFAKQVTIPARPMLGYGPAENNAVADAVRFHVNKATRGGDSSSGAT